MHGHQPDSQPLLLTRSRIRNTVKYLKKKRFIILAAIVAGGVFGVVYCSIKKPLYKAELTFSLEDEDKLGSGSLLNLASQFGLDIGGSVGGIFTGDNIIELYKSRKIIENSLLQPYDNSNQTFADAYLDISGKRRSANPASSLFPLNSSKKFTRLQDSIMGSLHEFFMKALLNVDKPDKRLNIYKVTFKSTNENFSKLYTETLVAEVSKFYTETKTKRAKQNVEILQNRVDSIRNVYNSALYGKASLIDANLNPIFQEPLVGIQKKQTDITVMGTAYGELLKNLELAKYSLLKQTPFLQIIDEPKYPLEKKTYPMWLYIPLSIFFFTFLAIFFLIAYKLAAKTYRYFS